MSNPLLEGLSSFWQKAFEEGSFINSLFGSCWHSIGDAYKDMVISALKGSVREMDLKRVMGSKMVVLKGTGTLAEWLSSLPSPPKGFKGPFKCAALDLSLIDLSLRPLELMDSLVGPQRRFLEGSHYKISEDGRTLTFDSYDAMKALAYCPYREFKDADGNMCFELGMWSDGCLQEDFALHSRIGWAFDDFDPDSHASTEDYRNYIKALLCLYSKGPSLENIKYALNISAGLPVTGETPERILDVCLRGDELEVLTDSSFYLLDSNLPMRSDLIEGNTLNPGSALYDLFVVSDGSSNPKWWHNRIVPEGIMPNDSMPRRIADIDPEDNVFLPNSAKFGDLGLLFGHCDSIKLSDDLSMPQIPAQGQGPPRRWRAATIIADTFLKCHGIFISFNPLFVRDPFSMISPSQFKDGLPADKIAVFEGDLKIQDNAIVEESFSISAGISVLTNPPQFQASLPFTFGQGRVHGQVNWYGQVSQHPLNATAGGNP